jgi:hypothetical protein
MVALQTPDKCSHTHVCCAFSIGLRLALEPNLYRKLVIQYGIS